jgi:hypothetical protein
VAEERMEVDEFVAEGGGEETEGWGTEVGRGAEVAYDDSMIRAMRVKMR